MKQISESVTRYLSILKLPVETPSLSYLERICQAQLHTFAFENMSKLIYFRDKEKNNFIIPPFDVFVNQYESFHFGGTCYTLNSNLLTLLKQLGFECYYIMLGKEHMAIIVVIDDERYYVDCGAAAPFFQPVPFETNHLNISKFGEDSIQLLPVDVEQHEYKYVRYTQGKQNGKTWTFNSRIKQSFEDFTSVVEASNQPGTTFMTILRCQIWQTEQQRSLSLVNNKFGIRYPDGTLEVKKLNSTLEIKKVIAEEFNLPKLPVAEAVEILDGLDIDIFSEE